MKAVYEATIDGFTFRRSTERTYTHCVVIRHSMKATRAGYIERAKHEYQRDLPYHRAVVAGTHESMQPAYRAKFANLWKTDAQWEACCAEDKHKSQAIIDKGEAGAVKEALAWFNECHAEQQLMADGDTYYLLDGFCGRADLAGKRCKSPSYSVLEARRSK